MMNAAGRLGRYVFLHALGGIAIAGTITLSAIFLVDVVEQIRLVGTRSELTLASALRLSALRAPYLLEQTLPFVVLTGTLFAMVLLSRRNEMTTIRAGGVSPWEIATPAVALAFIIGMFSTAVLSPLGSSLQRRYEVERNAILNPNGSPDRSFWISQGDASSQIILHAKTVEPKQRLLHQVTVFMFYIDAKGRRRFLRRLEAREARLVPGAWELAEVTQSSPFEAPVRHDRFRFSSSLGPDALASGSLRPAFVSTYALPKAIRTAEQAGLKPRRYQVRLHTLLAVPFLFSAMALIAAAFSDRLHRLGGVSAWIVVGIGTGFATYFLGQVSEALGSIGAVPPIAAGWGPPLAALFAASAALASGESRMR